ncbi:MAG: class I SAM-dependent methyltransferase [Oscillospiraceae bacterium]
MPPLPLLDARLTLIAKSVRQNTNFADIGTDHGYLPVYLVASGKSNGGYACDINTDPLQKAKALIVKYCLSDKIQTLLSDGLTELYDKAIDDIIIAGMGGELIADILDAAIFVQNTKFNFVLQPMTRPEPLRRYLLTHGFEIDKEDGVTAGKYTYSVMSVHYSGIIKECTQLYALVGELPKSNLLDSYIYLKKLYQKEKYKLIGLQNANTPNILLINEKQQLVTELQHLLEAKA